MRRDDQQTARVLPTETRPATDRLARAAARIARDAADAPEAYLEESEVPHGGE